MATITLAGEMIMSWTVKKIGRLEYDGNKEIGWPQKTLRF